MAELVKSHSYLRVLRQPDPWQATVSYICSATNRIERITKSVENIACELGDCRELDSDIRRTFPAAQKVLEAGEARLEELTVGLKSFPKRIVRTASRVIDRSLDLEHPRETGCLLCRGQTAVDGFSWDWGKGRRLHCSVCARKAGSIPC